MTNSSTPPQGIFDANILIDPVVGQAVPIHMQVIPQTPNLVIDQAEFYLACVSLTEQVNGQPVGIPDCVEYVGDTMIQWNTCPFGWASDNPDGGARFCVIFKPTVPADAQRVLAAKGAFDFYVRVLADTPNHLIYQQQILRYHDLESGLDGSSLYGTQIHIDAGLMQQVAKQQYHGLWTSLQTAVAAHAQAPTA